jgi:hypothetical protein
MVNSFHITRTTQSETYESLMFAMYSELLFLHLPSSVFHNANIASVVLLNQFAYHFKEGDILTICLIDCTSSILVSIGNR